MVDGSFIFLLMADLKARDVLNILTICLLVKMVLLSLCIPHFVKKNCFILLLVASLKLVRWNMLNLFLNFNIAVITMMLSFILSLILLTVFTCIYYHMWGDQAEWAVCREYWFLDTSTYCLEFLLYSIVLSQTKLSVSLELQVQLWLGFQQNKALWLLCKMYLKT